MCHQWVVYHQERVQYLTLSLDGAAADVLRDIDENSDTAWNKIWEALQRRFGAIDDARDAMHKFDACKQTEDMSIPEFEQKLRVLHHEAWPQATAEQRDMNLKRRIEDGVSLPEMRQFRRLHARTDNFDATVASGYQPRGQSPQDFRDIRFTSGSGQTPRVDSSRARSPSAPCCWICGRTDCRSYRHSDHTESGPYDQRQPRPPRGEDHRDMPSGNSSRGPRAGQGPQVGQTSSAYI